MANIQLVFVGHHDQRLLDTIRMVKDSFDKIILVKGEDASIEGETKCWETTAILEKKLAPIWKVEVIRVNKIDVLKATQQILGVVEQARVSGDQVVINGSGSMRTLTIAGYVASCLTGSRYFTALPKYNPEGIEIGAESLISVPLLPISFPSAEQLALMEMIGEGVEMLDDLVIRIKEGISKGGDGFNNERSRISHHLSNLEKAGYVTREKRGRNVKIILTSFGSMLLKSSLLTRN